ncbi:NADH dehydrogenase [ubiquinone] 1 beta subcomplex subunit 9 [Vespa velutina]|uniref:NADH dehydrogenase [ubiquinone] 1 beta subcomplex subunit 9 n=1 Tax=Vespa velutina TaxID=202808 RepID=UPI001FB35C9C|nr:NADH dehydrogenase [ubiquinone] 1 beta subcomplex subunit 9 [Vespa velutina]
MAQLPSGIVTHSQKVCSLYKRALLCLKCWYFDRLEYRYEAIKLRQRFEKNANIKDIRLAKHLLQEGEEELFHKQHFQPYAYPESPGGVAYKRNPLIPDSVLDSWDPIEKAMYPKYFARREQRKKEYTEWYFKQYPEKKLEKKDPH